MSYSCERTRTKAYNDDVRWRIVWQAMGLNYSVSKIAENFCVDESTVHRIINKFQATGEVQKKIYPLDKAYVLVKQRSEGSMEYTRGQSN